MAVIDELKILVTAEVAQAVANLNKVEGASNKAGMGFKDFAGQVAGYTTLAGLAVSATKAVISGVINLTKEAIRLSAGFETAQISWGVMLGDMAEGEKMFSKIQSLAAKTPLSFESVEAGARTLKQFGLATVDILPTIKMLGDVSAGNADKLRGLSIVYGQIMSTGRLMGQDLLQLINQGFNPLNIISQKTGESMSALKKRMEQGGISAQEVSDAFKTATSEGGLFYGMMDKTAASISGKWSTTLDGWNQRLAAMGEKLLPVISKILDKINAAFDEASLYETAADIIGGKINDLEIVNATYIKLQDELQKAKDSGDPWKGYKSSKALSEMQSIQHKLSLEAQLRAKAEAGTAKVLKEQADIAAKSEAARLKAIEDEKSNGPARLATWSAMNDAASGYFKMLADAEEAAQKDQAANDRARLATWEKMNERGAGIDLFALNNARGAASKAPDIENWLGFQEKINKMWEESSPETNAWDEYIKKLQDVQTEEEKMVELAEILGSAFKDAFEGIGEALVTGESGWKAFGKAGLQAISAIIEGFAKQYAALAIAEAFTPGMQGAAIGHAAAAAGLYVAAGAVKAIPLAEGGIIKARPGGTIARIGEGGHDEAVVPLKRGRGLGVTVNQYISGSVWNTKQLRDLAVDAVATANMGY